MYDDKIRMQNKIKMHEENKNKKEVKEIGGFKMGR